MERKTLKIVFMGTPDFAVPSLEKLIENHNVSLVITQPDKPKGRSDKLVFSPVKEVAIKNNIPVYQPLKARDEECIQKIKDENPDLLVVAAYGQILPEEMLSIPRFGSINVHASLLPKLRGAAPIQWAILNGDEKAGITIMRIAKKLDAGNIISQRAIDVEKEETGGSLFEKMSMLGGELLIDTIEDIANENISEICQNDDESTYAPMLKKEMGNIDWSKSAKDIERWIRGLFPWPGSYTYLNGKMYKIGKAIVSDENVEGLENEPGSISCDKKLYVRSGDGVIEIIKIQPSGKKMMNIEDFLRGHKIEGVFTQS